MRKDLINFKPQIAGNKQTTHTGKMLKKKFYTKDHIDIHDKKNNLQYSMS